MSAGHATEAGTGRNAAAWLAVGAFVVAAPVAFAIPRLLPFNGSGQRSWAGPVAAIFAGAVILFLVVRRKAPAWLAGLTAGLFGAWIVLMHATITRGTPFPMFGLLGDSGRVTAMATRYQATAGSADAWIQGLPGEYPPLFPWTIGRIASLLDTPAWTIVGAAEGLTTGAAIAAGFLMWQRLVPAWTALLTTIATFLTFANFAKSYELITLLVLVPWILAVFGKPERGRLHWLTAGVIGGLIFLTYYGWFVFAAIGIVALAVSTWRATDAKREFVLYVAKVAGVALVLSSWFLIPFLQARFTIGSEMLGDLYGAPDIFTGFFPFLQLSVVGAVQLVGLIGLLWLRNEAWWAKGLLYVTAGAYVYRIFYLLFFVATWHTGLGPYAARLSNATLAAAGVLTLAHLATRLALSPAAPRQTTATTRQTTATSRQDRRNFGEDAASAVQDSRNFPEDAAILNDGAGREEGREEVGAAGKGARWRAVPRDAVALGLAVVVAWTGVTFTLDWIPGMGGKWANYTERAYREPYPDGSYIKDSINEKNRTEWFPVTPVQQAVESVYGPGTQRVSLSIDERLYAYLPWHGYLNNDRQGSFVHWDERHAELVRIATLKDPSAFATASAGTKYGPIDIFVLRRQGQDVWTWTSAGGFNATQSYDVSFTRSQFGPSQWVIFENLPENVVVAVRR